MAIHWAKQRVNYLKENYKTELENQGDQYVGNQELPEFAANMHKKFANGKLLRQSWKC
jgi:hypothetical protein